MSQTDTNFYMLPRDAEETERLNKQHRFLTSNKFNLLHDLILPLNVHAVADIATGTGIWLQDVAATLKYTKRKIEFVGFDISGDQFPRNGLPDIDLVVHDATKPFPSQYQGKFDVVNVRFLSYAIKAEDLQALVDNLATIIRPGGFLQWQEIDAVDTRGSPLTRASQDMIKHVIEERMARGLPPAIVPKLLSAIQASTLPLQDGQVDVLTWGNSALRLLSVDSTSTNEGAGRLIGDGLEGMLEASYLRQQRMLEGPEDEVVDREKIQKNVDEIANLIEKIKKGEDPGTNRWGTTQTRFLARKAIPVGKDDNWMSLRWKEEKIVRPTKNYWIISIFWRFLAHVLGLFARMRKLFYGRYY